MELGTNWKRGGKGVILPPLSFELPGLYLNESCLYSSIFESKLEFGVSYKGGSKMDLFLDPLKTNGTKWTPLVNHKEA